MKEHSFLSKWREDNPNIRESFLTGTVLACLMILATSIAWAQDDEFPQLKIGGVLDARYAHTDVPPTWLDRGTGKLRYGGTRGERADLVRLSQASILLRAATSDTLSARLQLNVDAEPDRDQYRSAIDLIEGYVSYRPVLSPRFRLRARAGVFFPPISLENTGPAWTTPYSITTSSINTWIGEEVRLTGGELGMVFAPEGHELGFSVALFGNNDPAGSLLAWRGWTTHDRQTGFSERLPLPPIPALEPDGIFSRQAPYVQPFREIDGRLGYYGSVDWTNRRFELQAQRYDNRARQTDFDGAQYAWNTKFTDVGGVLRLPSNVEILSQYMEGVSRMGPSDLVRIRFNAVYVLGTVAFDRHRLTVRYDWYYVEDEDRFLEEDNNNDEGYTWTFAYLLRTGSSHRVALELIHSDSDRPARESIGQPANIREVIFQASFRLSF